MLKRIIIWLRGYLVCVIKGYSPERFLNLCSNHQITIWKLKKVEGGYQFQVLLHDYYKLRPIVRKTKTMPYVTQRFGLPFYIHRYKKRKIFFVGVLLAIAIVYYMSLFIWDIEVSGQYSHTEEAIVKFLDSKGVYAGVKKGTLNCQEIEETIRKRYSDIGWVSAEIRGTRLLLELTETNMPKPYEKQTEPCHIVADKDCVVDKIVTRKGTPMVREGQVVKKGDILVSGVIELHGDDQTIIKKEAVVADADVTVKTYYQYKSEFNLDYIDKVYTDQSMKYYSFTAFGKEFYLCNPLKNYNEYEKCDKIVDESTLKLNTNFYLPFSVSSIENKEYELVPKTYTGDEAIAKATSDLELYIKRLTAEDVVILDNQVVTTLTEDRKCVSEGKLIVLEPAHDTKKVTEEESYMEPTPEPKENEN
ncbi:MAG: sporulation protein YqfD [bacterium]|nr:sporulation protein YqfD [bacterium]